MNRPDIIDLIVPGADPAAIAAGIDAAWSQFEAADAWPWDAAAIQFELEGLDIMNAEPTRDISDREVAICDAWGSAIEAAYAAAWPGYPDRELPSGSEFRLKGKATYVQFKAGFLPPQVCRLDDEDSAPVPA